MWMRIVAMTGALVSLIALGFAVAQILPQDRHRLTPSAPKADTAAPSPHVTPATPPVAVPAPAIRQAPTTSAQKGFGTRAPDAEIITDLTRLDPRIQKMRERLIEAAATGRIERLHVVFQMNETLPVFTRGNERDPVAFWKSVSGDGQGIEVLAILRNILELPPARINAGSAQEMVVWPYLAQIPLDGLTPEQSVDLYRLVTAQDVRDMKTLGQWAFWRLGIGKDGTVHYFVAGQ